MIGDERRFRGFSYEELITLEFSVEGMIGTASAARYLIHEVRHEMHCQRHQTVGLPEPTMEDTLRRHSP